jgi:rRNA-processing protein FCF1
MHFATKRIKNISTFETEIGQIQFVVPDVVEKELHYLKEDPKKKQNVLTTIDFIKTLKKIPIKGDFADQAIIDYIKEHGGIIATMDKELKNKVKISGGSVISFANDRIVLES